MFLGMGLGLQGFAVALHLRNCDSHPYYIRGICLGVGLGLQGFAVALHLRSCDSHTKVEVRSKVGFGDVYYVVGNVFVERFFLVYGGF